MSLSNSSRSSLRRLVLQLAPWAAFAALGLAAACGGSTSSIDSSDAGGGSDGASSGDTGGGGGDSGGGGGDSGATDTGSDANKVCSTLTNNGAEVTINLTTDNAPTATGGTFGDATYDLADVTVYGSPIAGTFGKAKGKLKIAGNQAEVVVDAQGKTTSYSGTFTKSGDTIHLAITCPDTQTQDVKFSASTNDAGKPSLTLFADIQGKTAGETFVAP